MPPIYQYTQRDRGNLPYGMGISASDKTHPPRSILQIIIASFTILRSLLRRRAIAY